MIFDPLKIRADFPILSRMVNDRPLVYLDNGATAQKPAVVIETCDRLMREMNANIHRGVHFLSEECTRLYEEAREEVRSFIGAGKREEVVFTSGATASINTVAYSFSERYISRGDNIVVSEMEHHSNIVPWQLVCGRIGAEIRVLPFDDSGRLRAEALEGLIDGRTRIVAVTQASNVLGTRPDLKHIVETAHRHSVPVLVDGCQGIVHGGVDVTALDCDFYAFSGHKLYGPTGTGVLYGKERYLSEMPPFMGGGDMVGTVSFAGTTFAELPLKYEAGTANFIGAVGMAEAIRYIRGLDMKEVAAHEHALGQYATHLLSKIGGVRIYGDAPDKCSIVSFTADGAHHYDIGMILDKMGIAIRTGTHCAEPVMQHYSITGTCRASMAFYNTMEEMETFAKGVEKALKMLR